MTGVVNRWSRRGGSRCSNSPSPIAGQSLVISFMAQGTTLLPLRSGTSRGDSPGIRRSSSFGTISPKTVGQSARDSTETLIAKLEIPPFNGSPLDQITSTFNPVDRSAVVIALLRSWTRRRVHLRDFSAARERARWAVPLRPAFITFLTESGPADSSVSTATMSERPIESSPRASGGSWSPEVSTAAPSPWGCTSQVPCFRCMLRLLCAGRRCPAEVGPYHRPR